MTVTVPLALEALLEPSVAVRVTLFVPMSAQVKEVVEALKDGVPQLSLEPPSTSAAVMDEFPLPSR